MQFPLGMRPHLRSSFDNVFLFKDDFISNQKRIFDHYGGMVPSLEEFKVIYEMLTKDDYRSMVIVQNSKKELLEEKIFHYKANLK